MTAAGASTRSLNGFGAVGRELLRRTRRPRGEFVFWVYFVLCVLGLGGLGFWVELLQLNGQPAQNRSWDNAYTALVTFFPALIGSSCVQMVFETNNRRMQAFAIICCAGALVMGATLISTMRPASCVMWFLSIVMCLTSLWVWWIANADNKALHDEPPGDAAVGGDPDAPLAGDFGGIEV